MYFWLKEASAAEKLWRLIQGPWDAALKESVVFPASLRQSYAINEATLGLFQTNTYGDRWRGYK